MERQPYNRHPLAPLSTVTTTGMEPLTDDIRSLADKLSSFLIHLGVYLPLYEQGRFHLIASNTFSQYNMDFTSHKLLIFSCCDSGHKGHKGPGYHFTHRGLFLWAYPMSNVATLYYIIGRCLNLALLDLS